MLLQMSLFHSFLWVSNIPVCVCVCVYHTFFIHSSVCVCVCVCVCIHTVFIHSSVDGHLGWFHVLAIVNSANIEVHLFKWECLSFPGICPEVGLLDHMVALFLGSWQTSILFSIVAAPVYISTISVEGFLFSKPFPAFIDFLTMARLVWGDTSLWF